MNDVIEKICSRGFEAYIVGGYVRDYLLGFESHDLDICTNAKIEDIIDIFGDEGTAYEKYFSYHLNYEDYSYDITSYRKELKYLKNKPTKIEYASDLKTDLLRRDFTINTFAIDSSGRFVDLLNAKRDLDNRIIRVVGNAYDRFNQDKTRIIRALRFSSTLGFELDDDIKEFLKEHGDLIKQIPLEYIKKELDRIFDSERCEQFLQLVKEYKLEEYLNIEFDVIKKSSDRYGVWAQINTTLPLSNEEKRICKEINYLVGEGELKLEDFYTYSDTVVRNAAAILDLDESVREFYLFKDMHSIVDINIDIKTLSKYVKVKDIRKMYKLIEKNIMMGNVSNDTASIEEFIRSGRYE
jgi:tRNA nucleotidyltransferase (CCA-adding enzyme)